MNSKNSPLIHLHHATVRRGDNVVLNNLSLEIASGCSTVIDLLSSSPLSELLDVSVHVIRRGGWCFPVPALDGTPDDLPGCSGD